MPCIYFAHYLRLRRRKFVVSNIIIPKQEETVKVENYCELPYYYNKLQENTVRLYGTEKYSTTLRSWKIRFAAAGAIPVGAIPKLGLCLSILLRPNLCSAVQHLTEAERIMSAATSYEQFVAATRAKDAAGAAKALLSIRRAVIGKCCLRVVLYAGHCFQCVLFELYCCVANVLCIILQKMVFQVPRL
jgi:hypothetical protein